MAAALAKRAAVLLLFARPGAGEGRVCSSPGQCEEEGTSMLQMRQQEVTVTEPEQPANHLVEGAASNCNSPVKTFPYGHREIQRWGVNYKGWEQCAADEQSPINIQPLSTVEGRIVTVKGGNLATDYGLNKDPIALGNTGFNLGIDGNFGTLALPSVGTFTSANVHFHHPSEHHIDGVDFPLEMHIVNLMPLPVALSESGAATAGDGHSGAIAVVGILFTLGDTENACMQELFSEPCPVAGCSRPLADMNLGECFKEQLSGDWYSYEGSLTTPPCTQGVHWNVMKRTATVTEAQLREIKQRYLVNSRSVQPRHDRNVTIHTVE